MNELLEDYAASVIQADTLQHEALAALDRHLKEVHDILLAEPEEMFALFEIAEAQLGSE